MTQSFASADALVDVLIERVGRRIVLGIPLGLGKAVVLTNALYRRAKADPTLELVILTALTLDKPRGASPVERAFLAPFVERVFAGVPDLDYAADHGAGRLPDNVTVREFFVRPGSMLGNTHAQQNYISSNYSHAARDVFAQGCNVVAQQVARREVDGQLRYSLSANPDTGPELQRLLEDSGRPYVAVAEVNQRLPYMVHDADVAAERFHFELSNETTTAPLFPTPKMAVADAEHMIGLHAATLLRDGGTLQIGIGALGDAVVHASILRHQENARWRQLLEDFGIEAASGALIEAVGGREPFARGLYGATEMFVDGFLALYRAGVLKRYVYDDAGLQQLLNEGRVDPQALTPQLLDDLEALGERVIRTHEFETFQYHGVFRDDCRYELGHIIAPDGERIMANLAIPESRASLAAKCLGKRLRNGRLLHGGFFLGPGAFYDALNAMDEAERAQFCMTGVEKINQLDRDPALYKAQRIHARFVNTGLMATLNGAVVSDTLENGRVLSGVGGQYNFVAMAHHLLTGRSILMLRAAREADDGSASSNIVFNYGQCTIPRHLRDIIITEYGIADLRSQTDSEVARRLINIADSRFQPDLLAQAQAAGKIEPGYRIPAAHADNTPARIARQIGAHRDLFPAFPSGCDFTEEELQLGRALKAVKQRAASTPKWRLLLSTLRRREVPAPARPLLARAGLDQPQDLQARVTRALLLDALAADLSLS